MPVTSNASVGTVESYSAQIDGTPILTIFARSQGDGNIASTSVGIGTTTPQWLLHLTSTSTGQLSLDTGKGLSQWVFRNANGTFYLATTTAAGDATSSAPALTINSNGVVGIGTSSPSSLFNGRLSVAGPIYVGGPSTVATSTFEGNLHVRGQLKVGAGSIYLNENSTSTFSAGIQTTAIDITGGSATSTSNVGFNLSGGCFAINGACIGGSGSGTVTSVDVSGGTTGLTFSGGPVTNSGTITMAGRLGLVNGGTNATGFSANQLVFSDGTSLISASTTAINNAMGSLGIGTTTPRWALQIASSTGPQLTLSDTGTSHWSFRSIAGSLYIATSSATTFATTTTGAQAISIGPDNVVRFGNNTATCIALTGSADLCDGVDSGGVGGAANSKWATSSADTLAIHPTDALRVGIGTTTPRWALQIASSTGPQLTLSDGDAGNHWAFRSAGGFLYIDNPSRTTFATNTTPRLTFTSVGDLGIGTTSPATKLELDVSSNATDGITVSNMSTLGNAQVQLALRNGAGNTDAAYIRVTGTGVTPSGSYKQDALVIDASSGLSGGLSLVSRSGDLRFYTAGGGDQHQRAMIDQSTGRFGIATTSPFALLSLHADSLHTHTTLFAIGSSTASATTTLFSISNTGSTTASNGFNITNGCFAINGNCVGNAAGGTPGGSENELQFRINGSTFGGVTNSAFDSSLGALGIGTTTPEWVLQLASSSAPQLTLSDGDAGNHWSFRSAGGNFYLASSSRTTFATSTLSIFSILNNGNVGFATSSPGAQFQIQQLPGSTAQLFDISDASGTSIIHITLDEYIGIGTTTAKWSLQIASSTAPQLALSDGSIFSDHWTFRNAGGNFYLASSSRRTFATSTLTALTILGNSGNVGIGTSSPLARLTVIGGGDSRFPSFVVATSSWGATGGQQPLLYVTSTTTGDLDYARVAIGTTTTWGGESGLRDQFTVAGRIYQTWSYMACDVAVAGTTLAADTISGCGDFALDVQTDGALGSVAGVTNVHPPTIRLWSGNSGVYGINEIATIRGPSAMPATTSPVMEVRARLLNASATSTLYIIGFTDIPVGTTTHALPVEGVFFAASTTDSTWKAIVRTNGTANPSWVDTGIASTSVSMSTTTRFRIEVASTTNYFFINGKMVAAISPVSAPRKPLAPMLSMGRLASATGGSLNSNGGAGSIDFGNLRVWVDDPPNGGGGGPIGPIEDSFDPVEGADIAESYIDEQSGSLLSGIILSNSTTTRYGVRRSQGRYDEDIFGVVATSPRLIIGDEASTTVRVGMVGRLPAIVSLENGPIKIGDRITSSQIAGIGMRAGRPGVIVGRALEAFDPEKQVGLCNPELKDELIGQAFNLPSDACVARIMIRIEPGFDMSIGGIVQDIGVAVSEFASALEELTNGAFEKGAELTKIVVEKVVAQVAIVGKLFSKEVHSEKVCVSDGQGETCLTRSDLDALIAGAARGGAQPPAQQVAPGPTGNGGGATETSAPRMTLVGDDPLYIIEGEVFSDPGVTVIDDGPDAVPYTASIDGEVITGSFVADTPGTYTITYTATNGEGNTSTLTRTLIVEPKEAVAPSAPTEEPAPESPPEPPPQDPSLVESGGGSAQGG
jgi:hypothetical protein